MLDVISTLNHTEIQQAYYLGTTRKELTARYHVSASIIQKVLKGCYQKSREIDLEQFVTDWNNGQLKVAEIAYMYGYKTATSIYTRVINLRKAGYPLRIRYARRVKK